MISSTGSKTDKIVAAATTPNDEADTSLTTAKPTAVVSIPGSVVGRPSVHGAKGCVVAFI